jgi:mercuric ion transport protein
LTVPADCCRLIDRLAGGAPRCVIPLLLAAGVLSGAGWHRVRWLPGVAVVLAGLTGGAWWWAGRRRRRGGCAGGTTCACGA